MRTDRNNLIDVFRGILIMLVVLGHTTEPYTYLIYSFHMPAWFLISGILHRDRPWRELLVTKITGLLLPFAAASLICWALLFALNFNHLNAAFIYPETAYGTNHLSDLFLKCAPTTGKLGATWFLPVLFGVSLLASAMLHAQRRLGLSNPVLLILSASLMAWGYALGTVRLYGDLILFCQFFYILGYFAIQEKLDPDPPKVAILALAATLIMSFQYFFYNQFFNVIGRRYNSVCLLVLFTISGSFLLYLAAKHIFARLPWVNTALAYTGRKSLYILLFHFFGFKVMELGLYALRGHDPSFLTNKPNRLLYPHWSFTVLFAVAFSLAVGFIVEHGYRALMLMIFGKTVTMKSLIHEFLFQKTLA